MTCQKCCKRLKVVDVVHADIKGITYRKLLCPNCNNFSYSKEVIIDYKGENARNWNIFHRSVIRKEELYAQR